MRRSARAPPRARGHAPRWSDPLNPRHGPVVPPARAHSCSTGRLERVLVDSALRSHALPAPWEFRLGDGSGGGEASVSWRRLAFALELVATSNGVLLAHGVLQPAATKQAAALLLAATGAYGGGAFGFTAPVAVPLVGLAAVCLLPALGELYFFGDPLLRRAARSRVLP